MSLSRTIGTAIALMLVAVCGIVPSARAESGRPTGPVGASPAPTSPPPEQQKPSAPPPSQSPPQSDPGTDGQNQDRDKGEERVRLFEEYRQHKK